MGAAFALAGKAPRRYEYIASTGPAIGILKPMLVQAYLRTGAVLPGPETEETQGRHAGGAAYRLAEGVGEHVVKADTSLLLRPRIAMVITIIHYHPLDVALSPTHLVFDLSQSFPFEPPLQTKARAK